MANKSSLLKTNKLFDMYTEKLNRIHPNMVANKPYKDFNTPVLHLCKICNTERVSTPSNLLKSFGCNECSPSSSSKFSQKQYSNYCDSLGLTFLDDYTGTTKSYKYQCHAKGHVFACTPGKLKTNIKSNNGKGCYKCVSEQIRYEGIKNRYIDRAYNKKLTILEIPKKFASKGLLYCSSCDHIFESSYNQLGMSQSPCCPKFTLLQKSNTCKFNTYKIVKINDRELVLQGYEPNAIHLLLDEGYSIEDLSIQKEGNVPIINYLHKGKNKKHYPDLFIESENLIIEVKSNSTFGVNCPELFSKNKAKRKAAIKQGYEYRFIVMYQEAGNKPVIYHPLPNKWYRMDFETFNKACKETKHYKAVKNRFFS